MLGFLCVVGIGVTGYRLILDADWFDALYMTIITLSTVGYGETVPGLDQSPAGRVFTMGLILLGTGTLVYFASMLTAFFVEGELTNLLRRRKMDKAIESLNGHVILCGAGNTGTHVAAELAAIGTSFIAIDSSQAAIDHALEQSAFPYLVDDASDEAVLRKAGVLKARGIVTMLPTDKDNLYVAFTVRQLNPNARIVARGLEPANRQRLLRAGADAVVIPDQIGGMRLISELVRPHVVGFLDRMLRPAAGTGTPEAVWRIEEIEIAEGSTAVGKTLGALAIPEKIGVPVLGLTLPNQADPIYYPKAETLLPSGARLVVLAERAQVQELRQLVN